MISIYKIKPKFQQLLMPLQKVLHAGGITANQVTVSAIVLSVLIGICFRYAAVVPALFLALPIGLFIRMALNALDGMIARTYHQQSLQGEVLNELGDVVSDLFIFFPLLVFEHDHLYLVVTFMCLSVVNEFAGLLGKVVTGTRRYDGPMGKSDRAFMMGLYGLLSFLWADFSLVTVWIWAVANLLLVVSTVTRIKKSLT